MTRLQVLVNFNDFQILDFLSLKIGLDLAHFFKAKSEHFGGTPGKCNLFTLAELKNPNSGFS